MKNFNTEQASQPRNGRDKVQDKKQLILLLTCTQQVVARKNGRSDVGPCQSSGTMARCLSIKAVSANRNQMRCPKSCHYTDLSGSPLTTVGRALVSISTAKVLLHARARWSPNLGTMDDIALAQAATAVVQEDVNRTHFEDRDSVLSGEYGIKEDFSK